MSDLAQVLLLPPPTPPQRLTVRDNNDVAVNADQQSGGDSARARRFRFRVYEGGDSSEISVDYARGANGASNNARSGNAAGNATANQAQAQPLRYPSRDSGNGASSTFLAQAFAQEQLGEGLHNPPFATASAAYNATGAALNARASAGVDLHV
jgi:hypothetical protein